MRYIYPNKPSQDESEVKSRLLLQEQEIQTSIVNNVRVIKGIGRAICHHGELLQGIFEVKHGLSVRGLVTLPCGIYETTAYFALNENEENRRIT